MGYAGIAPTAGAFWGPVGTTRTAVGHHVAHSDALVVCGRAGKVARVEAALKVTTNQFCVVPVVYMPLFFTKLASLSFVVAVMCAEPTLCERGFAAAGGHFWFDVALLVDAVVSAYNDSHKEKLKST